MTLDCLKSVNRRISELREKIRKFPDAFCAFIWHKELDTLHNRRCLLEKKELDETREV